MITTNYPELKIEPLNANAPGIFQEVVSKISKLGNFWVSAGTALGLYRDKEFIPGDTDLDFACIGDGNIMGRIIESLQDFKVCRTIIDDGKPMQLCLIKDDVLVDFYFHYLEGDNYINYSGSGKQSMPRQIYDKLEVIDTKYGKIPVPRSTEDYFRIRYGDDWRTPQSNKKPHFEPAKGFPINYNIGLIFGTFDPLHFGHIRLFKNAKRFCMYLYVVTEDDEVIKREKHIPFTTVIERVEDLKAIRYIDSIVVRTPEQDRKYWVDKLKPDILFLGSDWKDKDWEGKHFSIPIIYIQRTKDIDSTFLRKTLI